MQKLILTVIVAGTSVTVFSATNSFVGMAGVGHANPSAATSFGPVQAGPDLSGKSGCFISDWSQVRGFNFQPPWASNGRDAWLERFDGKEYARLIWLGKRAFPGMNALRVWLSMDAWYDNPELFRKNIAIAARILKDAGVLMMPVIFNCWHVIPDYGGLTHQMVNDSKRSGWFPFRRYVREVVETLDPTGVVMAYDLCNEPLTNSVDTDEYRELMRNFLAEMSFELRRVSQALRLVSVAGLVYDKPLLGKYRSDLEFFAEAVDLFGIHPYCYSAGGRKDHRARTQRVLDEACRLGKPIVVTECCWDDPTYALVKGTNIDDNRGAYVDVELRDYCDLGVGFIVHALSPSSVADLHKSDRSTGFYMPFMDLDGKIRPRHEVFNKFSPKGN